MLTEFKGEIETSVVRLSAAESCARALDLLSSIERIYAEPLALRTVPTGAFDSSAKGYVRDFTPQEAAHVKAAAIADAEDKKARRLSRLLEEVEQLKHQAERMQPAVVGLELVPSAARREVIALGEMFEDSFAELERRAASVPQELGTEAGRTYYWYREKVWSTEDSLTPEDVVALLSVEESRKRRRLERAHALVAMLEEPDLRVRRQPIPQEVKVAVWRRDLGRCVECASQRDLEYDHTIPLAMGGSNTERNLQLLCADCNRSKGASLG